MTNGITINNKNYDSVLFVHIPKTAGTSVLYSLRKLGLDPWTRKYVRGHDPLHSLQENNTIKNSFVFGIVRNPYTRTYSAFKQFNKTNNMSISFLEYLNNIMDNNINQNTPLIHLSQSFFLLDKNGNMGAEKIYRFENLKEVAQDLRIELPKLNIGSYTKEEYLNAYSNDQALELVNHLYDVDFSNFNYEKSYIDNRGILENV